MSRLFPERRRLGRHRLRSQLWRWASLAEHT
jgi:hypothetical protein